MCYGRHFAKLTSCVPSVPIRRAIAALAADKLGLQATSVSSANLSHNQHKTRLFRSLEIASSAMAAMRPPPAPHGRVGVGHDAHGEGRALWSRRASKRLGD